MLGEPFLECVSAFKWKQPILLAKENLTKIRHLETSTVCPTERERLLAFAFPQ